MPAASPPAQSPAPASSALFRFRYVVFTIEVELTEERLEARGGMRTQVAPISRLEHLFVREDKAGGQSELLLSWRTAHGRLKRIRIFADRGEPGFDGLVKALLARRPDIDQRSLTAAEAYRVTGSRELEWLVLPGIMAIGWLVVAVLFVPLIQHGLDSGHMTVPVEQVGVGPALPTANLEVLGRPALDFSVRAEPSRGAPADAVTAWIPLVTEDWTPDRPVTAVLEVLDMREDLATFGQRRSFPTILRDFGWEGLSPQRKKALEARGLTLTANVKLLTYNARPSADLALALVVLGFMGLVTAGVAVVLWRRRRRPAT